MGVASDLKILMNLVAHPIRGATHAERLESFYSGQASSYDDFRERLLHGRKELIQRLPLTQGSTWIDIGAGTGSNLAHAGARLAALRRVTLVDLSDSLQAVARERIRLNGWTNIELRKADAVLLELDEPADVVTFSYSLTMIPDWIAAVERACANLRPGGVIGVTDFYVSRKYRSDEGPRHNWWTRTFWPAWFAFDNVFLGSDLLPLLKSRFDVDFLRESSGRVPYVPLGRVPYFMFVGRKQ
ncbi:Demethylmenaquinone methyltransferase [Caulifigura coniformis]|uniref:Demethylmenaquinone methyltransferase n=1 Tax=Caulifigura coniformis TaxID=2527983 RepID=A0A517SAD5_9PLAN|nr:methyltransferase domain-containing protein [Caulifigura coniformis]QDT53073.1 Demethylmenaquinone methyltransferase [Caulifigura coniformis]